MKDRCVYNREFLNTAKSGCMGAVAWHVALKQQQSYEYFADGGYVEKGDKKWEVNACIDINRDAQSHYVSRRAHLRPLYKMHRQLTDFINACETALSEAEEGNAKSS